MKKLIIKLLFRLLEDRNSYEGIKNSKIDDWLASQHGNPGFVEYFRKRDLQILKAFGTLPEEKYYWILAGQRMELIHMANRMKQQFEGKGKPKKHIEK
jgi:hypothetical protein